MSLVIALALGLALGLALLAGVLLQEVRGSYLQSHLLSRYAQTLDHALAAGPGAHWQPPRHGPFNERLGYTRLPDFIDRLQARRFEVTEQAVPGDALRTYLSQAYFAPYREKTQTGLTVLDCRREVAFAFRYPYQRFESFEDVPPALVEILLFIENRGLLDEGRPHLNPAVDWARFARAMWGQLGRHWDADMDTPGGSTLATQIEKFRHSPEGRTADAPEKLRQMVSAAVRAYRDGPQTLPMRRRIVLDYLNTVPLSAAPRHGEVHGLGDGWWVWFGTDFGAARAALADMRAPPRDAALAGRVLLQAVALMIAHRRPSWYLAQGRDELDALARAHLRRVADAGLIAPEWRDAALAQPLVFRDMARNPPLLVHPAAKGTMAVRARLAGMLGTTLYQSDRLDAELVSTLNAPLQDAVTQYLQGLSSVDEARRQGLLGPRLLQPEQVGQVHYSFTLLERTPGGNRVRVQTDTTGQPLDINEGSQLELGSTAKLRVLSTYLELVAELHERLAPLDAEALRALNAQEANVADAADRRDSLTRWAIAHLRLATDKGLPVMLEAALERRFSADPHEAFFTGGGVHRFHNFRPEDDARQPSLREALRESINLPFIRLMREIVRHTMYQVPGSSARLLQDRHDPRREAYLLRFADREGQVFLRRFWRKLDGRTADELRALQLDRAYVARVHPLEWWLVAFRLRQPAATLAEAVRASEAERRAVYRWLLRTPAKSAQDTRIATMLEVEAFLDIHRRWARLGYPFGHLVPSLATALGSSGDRPAALAELMGIIVNDGLRLPTQRIAALRFAEGTPWETALVQRGTPGERVMPMAVAQALRQALAEVVEAGTARRLAGGFTSPTGMDFTPGGKTGTGDNRVVVRGRGATALNRTATFVFFLGPRHFGTVTAYVVGPASAGFRFTSGLPVQILRTLGPALLPYLDGSGPHTCPVPVGVVATEQR